jgi:hypothetical protein
MCIFSPIYNISITITVTFQGTIKLLDFLKVVAPVVRSISLERIFFPFCICIDPESWRPLDVPPSRITQLPRNVLSRRIVAALNACLTQVTPGSIFLIKSTLIFTLFEFILD